MKALYVTAVEEELGTNIKMRNWHQAERSLKWRQQKQKQRVWRDTLQREEKLEVVRQRGGGGDSWRLRWDENWSTRRVGGRGVKE